jgi:Protein of unknown function (DUF2752)
VGYPGGAGARGWPTATRVAWRPDSTAERLGLTGLGVAAASFVYPLASRATGLGLPCPLRTLTGVPCPFCGMTTAATSLAAGRLHDALAANPFALVLAGGTLVMALLMVARAVGAAPTAVAWPPARRRLAWSLALLLLAASWVFELHRFGWV